MISFSQDSMKSALPLKLSVGVGKSVMSAGWRCVRRGFLVIDDDMVLSVRRADMYS